MLGCLHLDNSKEVLEWLFLDRTCPVSADWTLRCLRLVDSSKVLECLFLDRTCLKRKGEQEPSEVIEI